jgi:alpha-tubulin suppressor-like RCC1 family protein/phosphodiesterase/alkaline phosphatase D-like protein
MISASHAPAAATAKHKPLPRRRRPGAGPGRRLLPLLLILLSAPLATAQSIAIQDPSFDDRQLNAGGWSTTITPWQETNGPGSSSGFIEHISGFAADGANHLGMGLNHNVWQDPGVTYQANTRYTLTVAAGNRSSTHTHAGNQSQYLLADSTGAVHASGSFNASSLPAGTFADAPALVFETGTGSPAIGRTIRILLQARGSGRSHFDRIRLTAVPTVLPPAVQTDPATGITDIQVTLHGTVHPQGGDTVVWLEYGTTETYGSTVSATPAMVSGASASPVAATLSGLAPGTTYHYRVVASNIMGTRTGANRTFVTETPAHLSALTLSEGTLAPSFEPNRTDYAAQVPPGASSITLTPETTDAGATIRVQGVELASGATSAPVPLPAGNTVITVGVTAAGSSYSKTYLVTVTRPPTAFVFANSATPAIEAAAFDATGLSIDLSLGFAPEPGTNLTVVRQTGTGFIKGAIEGLAQGQTLRLIHAGISYPFEVNYHGGDGNDLLLEWANTRLLAWGSNNWGQLGIGTRQNSPASVAVPDAGVLAGKRIVRMAAGYEHSLVLCSDGTLAAWGGNSYGQLGNNTTTPSDTPVLVNTTGALAGKRVVAITAGHGHNLALCSDGTVVAWGHNSGGMLGAGHSNYSSLVPVAVDRSGVLAGRTVVSIAAGSTHSLALCADGVIAAWGRNFHGSLGDGSNFDRNSPVAVIQSGVLAGRTVVGLAGGLRHSLALCADGTVAVWGGNDFGQLGIGSTTTSLQPVPLHTGGVLAGKTVVAVAAGLNSSYALCADGTLASWGQNSDGQLGNGSTVQSTLPVAVTQTAALTGRTITMIGGGMSHAYAFCSDGKIALWGMNAYGQLGTGDTTSSMVPVLAGAGVLRPGERLTVPCAAGGYHMLAIAAAVPPPLPATMAAANVGDQAARLMARVNANGSPTDVIFEYGLTPAYGNAATATPARLAGTTETLASAQITGLPPGTAYHFRVVAASAGGIRFGEDHTFTTTTTAALAGLDPNLGQLKPTFQTPVANYSLTVANSVDSIRFTPATATAGATVTVAGVPCAPGAASAPVPLAEGSNPVPVVVTSPDGNTTFTYTVTVARIPQVFSFGAENAIGLSAARFDIGGMAAGFSLDYAPPPGTGLTVLENTGGEMIGGEFANLAHGQLVILEHGGLAYPFAVNYFGGSGNDLVLEWANTRPVAWGGNQNGQLGAGDTVKRPVPVAVDRSGILDGRTILVARSGNSFNVVLSADGTLASWGINFSYGQLGNNRRTDSNIPTAVDATGVLAGRRPIAVATGAEHALVLCADGTLATWGRNNHGQLGNGSTVNFSSVPVAVDRGGVLAGKTVVAISAGPYHNLVGCSDGTLAAWGHNSQAQLGDGTLVSRPLPVRVITPDFLIGKAAVRITAGDGFNLALHADGTLAGWGANDVGQLGIGTVGTHSAVVHTGGLGVLAGKSIIDVTAGGDFAMALCSDGTLATWGSNTNGELGNNGTSHSAIPVAVERGGVLAGKTVTNLAAGTAHALVRCSDGTMAAWGWNALGGLGNNTQTLSRVPVPVDDSILDATGRFGTIIAGGSNHSLAVVAAPPPPVAETLAATGVGDNRATLHASVFPNGAPASVSFEYGLTTGYGSTIAATVASFDGTGSTAASGTPEGLLSNTTYHYRVVAANANGTWRGKNMTFTTTGFAALAGLAVSAGQMVPAFAPVTTGYALTVLNPTDGISLTPVAAFEGATITVNGAPVVSGEASQAIGLAEGDNRFEIVVAAPDGVNSQTYTVTVTRVPQRLRFDLPGVSPLHVATLAPTGGTISFDLTFHPAPGTDLTAINQSGWSPIDGAFANLAQGQRLILTLEGMEYEFAADYFGGDGNDLVLRWAHGRLLGWGMNGSRQLGIDQSSVIVPTPMDASPVLDGQVVSAMAAGAGHSLVLCADGTLASVGSNAAGQLGNPDVTGQTSTPVPVVRSGPLAGRTVVATAAGQQHSLALCADGTLAAWGNGANGRLGNNGTSQSNVPVPVETGGTLAGRRVIAITAGYAHNLALCEDGGVVAWGRNDKGQLGDGSFNDALEPVALDDSGVLAGRRVVALAAGEAHSLALCEDGTVAAWGDNASNQLGDVIFTASNIPVAVELRPVLMGRSIVAVAAGGWHNLLLLEDGTMAGWGRKHWGQLAVGGTGSNTTAPVTVPNAGALARKEVAAIAAGDEFSLTRCSDNTVAGFGFGFSGRLGNGSTFSFQFEPSAVVRSNLRPGERFSFFATGPSAGSTLAWVTTPPPSAAATLAATDLRDMSATLNGSIRANGSETAVRFEFGPTREYGTLFDASPPLAGGVEPTPVSFKVDGLVPGRTYHYRVVATGPGGMIHGADVSFSTTTLATLSGLSISESALAPEFDFTHTRYTTTVPFGIEGVAVTPLASHPEATLRVNGAAAASGAPGPLLPLSAGNNLIVVEVTSGDGENSMSYVIDVIRMPAEILWSDADDVPLEAGGFLANGNLPPLVLGHAPHVGSSLMLVKNTGEGPVSGKFANLDHGQQLRIEFNGISYPFFANYFGGDGNDLTLDWANTRIFSWGAGSNGRLGNGDGLDRWLPTPVDDSGVLAGKSILEVAAAHGFSVALATDGSLAAWGDIGSGLFDWDSFHGISHPVAVALDDENLAGKTVVGLAAGYDHVLALRSDGVVVAMGMESQVMNTGALAGKRVIAIAAGAYGLSVALCSDGTIATWGLSNDSGQFGNGTATASSVPVAVDMTGVLAGKRVVKVAAGYYHCLALCSDGTLAGWGTDSFGCLGSGLSGGDQSRPVLVDRNGVLAGKTITEIAAGRYHSVVCCADGTVAAWGWNLFGQLGDGSTTDRSTPAAVIQTGVLHGKTVTSVFAGEAHSMALCSDGTLAAWGANGEGILGNNTNTNSTAPVLVDMSRLRPGERILARSQISTYGFHTLAVAAAPPAPQVGTLVVADITSSGAVLHAEVRPNGSPTTVWVEYGHNESYGTTVAPLPATVNGSGAQTVTCALGSLLPDTTYHFRIVVENEFGTIRGEGMTFTTKPAGLPPVFAGYTAGTPWQTPASIGLRKLLAKASDPDGGTLAVTAAGPVSASGGTVALLAEAIRYTPPAGFSGTDAFSITITDDGGASVTGSVNVVVGAGPHAGAAGNNPPMLGVLPGGGIGVSFQGIPGRAYAVQRSIGGLDDWETLATLTADASGKVSFTDDNPPPGSAFYRLGLLAP